MEDLLKFRDWALEKYHYSTVGALDSYFMLLENRALDTGVHIKMKEQDIQAKILSKLRDMDHYSINVVVASRGGVSDIISCDNTGRFWSIEVKQPGERPRKLQDWNLNEVAKRKGVAFWCDSYDDFLVKFNNNAVVKTY